MEYIKTLGAGVAGAVATGIGIISFQQESAQAQADRAERIKGAEVRIEKVEMELNRKESELEKIADRLDVVSDRAGNESLRQELKALSLRLKAVESAPSSGAGPTAEQVARVLMRDYADTLRGPVGPVGPKGDKGEPGAKGDKGEQGASVAGGAVNPRAPIKITTEYRSSFEDQYWKDARVSLIGCSGKGTRVKCNLMVFPEQDIQLNLFASAARVALPDGVFAWGAKVTLGNQGGKRADLNLSGGVPTKLVYEFGLETGGHDGLLEIRLTEHMSGEKLIWKDVPLVD